MAKKRGARIYAKRYGRFRGVDFSTDPALLDDAHSPWAPNLIADEGGMPEKRPGWRTLARFGAVIGPTHYRYGVFEVYCAHFNGERHVLALARNSQLRPLLYRVYEDGTSPELLWSGASAGEGGGQAVFLGGALWIFAGSALLRYDGHSCVRASSDAYIPTTLISCDPAGGGQPYEAVNKLTGMQRVGFLADGTSTVYRLPCRNIAGVSRVEVSGNAVSSGFTVNAAEGTVTFSSAPAAPAAGAGDNVFITFDSGRNSASDIECCHIAFAWGVGGAGDRIVAAPYGSNIDYISAYNDPTYWPDVNYSIVGGDDTPIMGYRRLGEQLAVVKGDGGNGGSVFIRSAVMDESGGAAFPLKPCIAGVGAVCARGFGNIGNEQLVLTRRGVYALVTNDLTAERVAVRRSGRIDARLTREDLRMARCCSWKGCFLIFTGGRVYGLDGRRGLSADGGYECFHWENVPASCAVCDETDGSLFFGTADGRLCRFNTDVADMSRYSDDGEPITAVWSTKLDDDGDPTVYKTLLKNGCAASVKALARSSAKILLRTDRDAAAHPVAEKDVDVFDWTDIDFSRFTFSANDAPVDIPLRCKVKNYKRLQILVKNDTVNEGFGVYGIVKRYVAGNFAR